MWDTSCPDWEDRILNGRSLVPDLPLIQSQVETSARIFRRLRLPNVAGQPRRGDVCAEFLYPIVAAVFGSYDPVQNVRYINEFFMMIPKGNDKTGTAAAIGLVWALMNRRVGAEAVIIAPSKTIADRGFSDASGAIKADPELEKVFYPPSVHQRKITHRMSEASISVIAADTTAATGGRQALTIVDETHELSLNSQASAIMTELRGAIGKSPDNLMMQITTQSKKPPSGMFRAELEMARDVRDGKIRLPLLPILYELPKRLTADGGWKKRAFWHLVNPNIGYSLQMSFIETQFLAAERKDLAAQALFASQHLNVEIGVGLSTDGWVGALYWLGAEDPELSRGAIRKAYPDAGEDELSFLQLQELCDRCEVLTMGVDGGGLDDLLGVAVVGREYGTGRWLLWGRAMAAPIALERNKANLPDYEQFQMEGDLIVSDLPADMDDLDLLIEFLDGTGKLATVSVDPACVDDIAEVCAKHDITEENGRFVGERQGIGLMKAIKTVERKLFAKKLLHCGQALMRWCAGNARVRLTSAAMLIEREASGKAKIDPLMAAFNAIMGMTANPEPPRKTSVYEERGIIIL